MSNHHGSRSSIAVHPRRTEIEADMGTGLSNTQVAEKYGLSRDAVRRYRLAFSDTLKAVSAAHVAKGAETALQRVEGLYERASRVLDAVEADGKAALTLQALKELRGIVELLAKLTGELDERPQVTVNLQGSDEWVQMRQLMLQALTPFPDAALVVAESLKELES